ncbi:hypothetical protein JTE90_007908 [Oedothorax gibbosus]|uniref:Uncharacterized protein n=1 Tax=Oedothorax gibbosus TaxID=931172 RepID=A0AAV6VJU8_9ARAC|nr:hypothetical protein JTE90_007908 [Oedothorax gibbosus]
MDKITIFSFIICSIFVSQVQSKKEHSLQRDLLSTTAHKPEITKTPAMPVPSQLQGGTSKSFPNSTHATSKAEILSSTHSKAGHKMTPAKKIPGSGDPSSKLVSKIRHKTTPKTTTTELTTIETTTETTTELTTVEETTTETTTIEETTTETTTVEETTTESTTIEETTTEMTTVETTTEDITTHSAKSNKPTPRLKSGLTTEDNSATKSWQKYLKKTTSLPIATAKSNKELLMKSVEKQGTSTVAEKNGHATTSPTISNSNKALTMNLDEKEVSRSTTKENYHGATSPYVNTRPSEDSTNQNGVKMRKTYTSSTNDDEINESSTAPSNTSVDVKVDIDIDIKLRSSLSSTEGNSSEEYFSSTTATSPMPRNREKRQQKKKVLAGVILVVLISLSAAFAVMFVLVPAKTEVRTRRYHRRPDQVELITPGRRNRPRFYDATIYMGY